ncbi:hypothetical protein [Flavisolibacter ginsenosidimutans]|uniref:Uncharacterized protein n=1 Tax=Flavisolibacter ginsenosidimutans TaxID=661481 RepID=A0A5B8UMY2_9BACT|nr:hypothetical protein [Flavisolibacter ginsenosidimutans]QEC57923.1 hypothetical protein FSB75_19100 [Flavisolibacter ginsenosidimutans]
MVLQIDDNLKIGEVQERFHDCFPYLKIAFYAKAHKRFEPSETKFLLDEKSLLADIRKTHQNGNLEIKSWHTVARVEHELKQNFGLNAQIFRTGKKGEWVQTAESDALTLEEQSRFAYDWRLNK